MSGSDYIQRQVNHGRWTFTSSEMNKYLGYSSKDKLSVLRKKRRIISPSRGFYVIVPEEYLLSQRLPVERYIDPLMSHLSLPYYVGLLTASSFYGASHQSPQHFQVIIPRKRRNISVNRNKIVFYQKKNMEDVPVAKRKTSTGYFNISTPEATFLDLVEFQRQIGGFEQVGLITMELSEKMNPELLAETVKSYPMPVIQRAGYLLELTGQESLATELAKIIHDRKPVYSYLNPSENRERVNKHSRWKLFINDEPDIEV